MVVVDGIIRDYVIDELNWEPEITNPAAIGVAVAGGVVELTGNVDSYVEKLAAEMATKRVSGVQSVVQNIEVKYPYEIDDIDIAQSIRTSLDANVSVPSNNIKITVQNGCVTLEGTVYRPYQRKRAEDLASQTRGIKKVTNYILIETLPMTGDVKNKIEDALKRMAAVDANRIIVEITGNTIILRGTVRSWAQKEEAKRVAYSVPGITEVQNNITIAL